MATSKQDDYIKTALRLPRDLHAKIISAADNAERTMNAEIISRLQSTFDVEVAGGMTRIHGAFVPPDIPQADVEKMIDSRMKELEKRLIERLTIEKK